MSYFNLPYNEKISKDKKTLYKNARIIDPETKFDKIGQLLTIGDKIIDFGENILDKNDLNEARRFSSERSFR